MRKERWKIGKGRRRQRNNRRGKERHKKAKGWWEFFPALGEEKEERR